MTSQCFDIQTQKQHQNKTVNWYWQGHFYDHNIIGCLSKIHEHLQINGVKGLYMDYTSWYKKLFIHEPKHQYWNHQNTDEDEHNILVFTIDGSLSLSHLSSILIGGSWCLSCLPSKLINALVSSTIVLSWAQVTTQEGITSEIFSSNLSVSADVTSFITTSGLAITFPLANHFLTIQIHPPLAQYSSYPPHYIRTLCMTLDLYNAEEHYLHHQCPELSQSHQ